MERKGTVVAALHVCALFLIIYPSIRPLLRLFHRTLFLPRLQQRLQTGDCGYIFNTGHFFELTSLALNFKQVRLGVTTPFA
jgi:hypothetical protein